MKKFLSSAMLAVSMLGFPPHCEATDVWVDHWNYEDVDIFVMDDTIASDSNAHGRGFTVSTKEVKNGKLQRVINWCFDNGKGWRYSSSRMDPRITSRVIPRNNIFEFCMNRLGWSYSINNGYYD